MSDTPPTPEVEALALPRRGLPLAQADSSLPRSPWLPAAIRSRAVSVAAPAAAPVVIEEDSTVDAPVADDSEYASWLDEAYSLSFPSAEVPPAKAITSTAGALPHQASTRPVAVESAAVSALTQRAPPPDTSRMDATASLSPATRVGLTASPSTPMPASSAQRADAPALPNIASRIAAATTHAAPTVPHLSAASPAMPGTPLPAGTMATPAPERLPHSVLASLPSATATSPTAVRLATPVFEPAPQDTPRETRGEPISTPATRTMGAPLELARRIAPAAPLTQTPSPMATVTAPTMPAPPSPVAMGWPRASNDHALHAAPAVAPAPLLTTQEREALLAPPRTEPQGVHIGQVHVTVQAPAAAPRAAAAAAPAPRAAAPTARAPQPAPYRSPWAGAYRRRD